MSPTRNCKNAWAPTAISEPEQVPLPRIPLGRVRKIAATAPASHLDAAGDFADRSPRPHVHPKRRQPMSCSPRKIEFL